MNNNLCGVVLAGGTATRMHPSTLILNKHVLNVYDRPMIYYPIDTLVKMGIKKILIILGGNSIGDLVNLLQDGEQFECDLTYKYQKSAAGIADAIRIAEDFVGNRSSVVILGDNIFLDKYDEIPAYALKFEDDPFTNAMCVVKEMTDPSRFGVAEFDGDKIISIEEKPRHPKSDFAITGLYFLKPCVFKQIKNLKPSPRGEYEITDLLKINMEINSLKYQKYSGLWSDAGTHESLLMAGNMMREYKEKI